MTPQAPQDRPDTVDQERISRLAQEQADQLALRSRKSARRQEQVDLTEDLERQQEVERKQRLREQQLTRSSDSGEKRPATLTRLEEQRLQQLADMQRRRSGAGAAGRATRRRRATAASTQGLLARYKAADAAERGRQLEPHRRARAARIARSASRQIPGGEVIDVEFMSCPYDDPGRDSVERAAAQDRPCHTRASRRFPARNGRLIILLPKRGMRTR